MAQGASSASESDASKNGSVPRHVAIIMDGNGRWAKAQGLPRLAGHRAGAESVRAVVRQARRANIEVLTLYSFSTENWNRPADEVSGLMKLLTEYLKGERDELLDNGIQLRGIGELHRLPAHVRMLLKGVCRATAHNTGMQLNLALSYGSRAEMVNGIQHLAKEVRAGRLDPRNIDEALVSSALYTAGQPDPDLLIRTSGELRLSNFLLWQLAYAELYVTDLAWPDFREDAFDAALASFAGRQRRFGKTGAQVIGEKA